MTTIQNRLSALLRAHPPGGQFLFFLSAAEKHPKNTDVFWNVGKPQSQEANNVFPYAPPQSFFEKENKKNSTNIFLVFSMVQDIIL